MNVQNCTGCAACLNICPHDAIVMKGNSEGFDYPLVQKELCTDCDLCRKTCPVLSKDHLPKFRAIPDVFAAWHRNQEIRLQSSSGGVFSAFASSILEQGGVVFGAVFDKDFSVYHKSIDSEENVDELRRSKYIQSRVGNSFREVKHHLEGGSLVLFVGTPCQTAGLLSYLKKPFYNLFTCALVCTGAPSPKVFRQYLKYIEQTYNSSVASYSFRDKREGWACKEAIRFNNGKEVFGRENNSALPSFYYAFSHKALLSRKSCYVCPFKGLPGYADIILGDFWSIRNQEPNLDDDKGTSMVLVNSDKGQKLLNISEKYLSLKSCPFRYIQFNSTLMRSARCPKKRAKLFTDIDHVPFEQLYQKYMRPPNALEKFIKKTIFSLKWCIKNVLDSIEGIRRQK